MPEPTVRLVVPFTPSGEATPRCAAYGRLLLESARVEAAETVARTRRSLATRCRTLRARIKAAEQRRAIREMSRAASDLERAYTHSFAALETACVRIALEISEQVLERRIAE